MTFVNIIKKIICITAVVVCLTNGSQSVYAAERPGISERLGSYVPLNLTFRDENNKDVLLKDILKKPTAFAFVYYKCPGICTPLMTEIAATIRKVDLTLGKDYNIVTLSMDQFEKPETAYQKKKDLFSNYTSNFKDNGWYFLTGDSSNIKSLADSLGFSFVRKDDQFLHTAAVIFLSTDGKISRYLYPSYTSKREFSILPFDFKMAIIDAGKGEVTPTIAKVLQFCFSYDPQGRTYVFNLLKVFGAGTLLFVAIFIFVFIVKPKKKLTR